MKRKLTLMVLTVLVLLIGKAEALTLTQKLGSEYIVTSVESGEEVNMTFTSKVGFKFKNWVVSGITGVDTTSPTLNFAIQNQNVVVEGKYIDKYTVTFNANGGQGSMTNQSIPALGSKKLATNTFTRDGYSFTGWAESANGSKKYDDEENITPDKDLELYAVWEEEQQVVGDIISLESLPIGAYIAYNPVGEVIVSGDDSGTGEVQKFNTASDPYTDGWRVMYKDNGKITLISAKSVGDLTLGKYGSASNDETNSSLNGGKTGYAKAIYTLNKMCRDFATGDFAVKSESRCLGYNGTAIENMLEYTKTDGTKITLDDITHANIRSILGSQTGSDIILAPWEDDYNSRDVEVLEELGDIDPDDWDNWNEWWLASRSLDSGSEGSRFNVRTLDSDGLVLSYYLYERLFLGDSYPYAFSDGVRPIIVLESGIKVIGGEGKDGLTANTAYTLSR